MLEWTVLCQSVDLSPSLSLSLSVYGEYVVSLSLLLTTPVQAEYTLYHRDLAARVIGLNMNTDKTKFKGFNKEETFSFEVASLWNFLASSHI